MLCILGSSHTYLCVKALTWIKEFSRRHCFWSKKGHIRTKFCSHSPRNCWNFWEMRSWAHPTALRTFPSTEERTKSQKKHTFSGICDNYWSQRPPVIQPMDDTHTQFSQLQSGSEIKFVFTFHSSRSLNTFMSSQCFLSVTTETYTKYINHVTFNHD